MLIFYISSSVIFLLITFFFYKISPKINLLDSPNKRKIHSGDIPLIGGIGIYFNILLFSFFLDISYEFKSVVYFSSILFILSLADDSIELGVSFRLVTQFACCLIIIGSGIQITNLGEYMYFSNIDIGLLSIAFTVFCVIGLTNAFNFIDGIDGLCAGLILTSIFSIIIFSLFNNTLNQTDDFKLIFILIISIILFLFLNLTNYYKIFLGDSGSITLGFILSWILIIFSQSEKEFFHPILTLWAVTLPVYDISSVVIRRILRGINPFKPDRRHVHHILLRLGVNNHYCLILILLSSIILNISGFLIFYLFGPMPSLVSFLLFFMFYLYLMMFLSKKSFIR